MDVSRLSLRRFAAQAQGFVKVTRLRRNYTWGFAVSEWCFRGVELRCYRRRAFVQKFTFATSLVENARFGSVDSQF